MSALSLASIPSFSFSTPFLFSVVPLFLCLLFLFGLRRPFSLLPPLLPFVISLFLPFAISEFLFVTSVIYELPFVISLLLPSATSELPLFFSLPPLGRPTCEILLPVLPAFLFRILILFVDQQSW